MYSLAVSPNRSGVVDLENVSGEARRYVVSDRHKARVEANLAGRGSLSKLDTWVRKRGLGDSVVFLMNSW